MTISKPLGPRWTSKKAWDWHAKHPWVVGCNYLPSYAVNFVDMWHKDSFDPTAIATELEWASSIGMNSVRVNLQFLQWEADPEGQSAHFETFLDIASDLGISVVPCLFDDCGFSGDPATAESQPDPRPGVHNGRALASPGREIVMDDARWPECLDYLREVITRFADNPNILFWDLYNEPGNGAIFLSDTATTDVSGKLSDKSLAFLSQVFAAAQEVNPDQPLTSGAWRHRNFDTKMDTNEHPYQNEIDQFMLVASDVISYHGYVDAARGRELIDYLKEFDRPIYCMEWMARNLDSRINDQLAVMQTHHVGAYQWGLVQGRSQTYLPWPQVNAKLARIENVELEWFHDLLRPDGTPYIATEVETIKTLTNRT